LGWKDYLAFLDESPYSMRLLTSSLAPDQPISTPQEVEALNYTLWAFQQKILDKMREEDQEAARIGEITPDKILSYNIVLDGDTIREVTIQSVTQDRSRELKSAIRWTLERMWEKCPKKPHEIARPFPPRG